MDQFGIEGENTRGLLMRERLILKGAGRLTGRELGHGDVVVVVSDRPVDFVRVNRSLGKACSGEGPVDRPARRRDRLTIARLGQASIEAERLTGERLEEGSRSFMLHDLCDRHGCGVLLDVYGSPLNSYFQHHLSLTASVSARREAGRPCRALYCHVSQGTQSGEV